LEEAGLPSHEELAMTHFAHPSLRSALRHTGFEDIESRLQALITGRSQTPLQGLISGSLDLDKLEYLSRDARMCGVPYGAVDVDRLLHAITVLDSDGGSRRVGIREKGISALESLLFARYQMYRNVYWHHAVRSATAMFKRAVRTALAHGELTVDAVAHSTDEGLMQRLRETHGNEIATRLRQRKLYKRLVDIAGEEVPEDAGDWVAECPDLVERVENKLAANLRLQPGEVLLDFPAKAKMIEVDMPLLRKDGTVEPLAAPDGTSQLGIHRIADELHARARRLRVFAATSRPLDQQYILQLVERKKNEVESDLASDTL
jgi:hypothetical protein